MATKIDGFRIPRRREFGGFGIRIKIFFGYFLVSVFTLLIGFVGYRMAQAMETHWTDLSEKTLPMRQTLETMRLEEASLFGVFYEIALVYQTEEASPGRDAKIAYEKGEIEEAEQAFKKAYDDYQSLVNAYFPHELNSLSQLTEGKEAILRSATDFFAFIENPTDPSRLPKTLEAVEEADSHFRETVAEILAGEDEEFRTLAGTIEGLSHQTISLLWRMSLWVFLVSILFGLILSRAIVRPIAAVHSAALAIADGDLKKRAMVLSDDEIGEMAHSFNAMAEKLSSSNATLERRVEARTAELRHSKEGLERANLKLKEAVGLVTQEKAKAESFLSSIGEGVLALDREGHILMVNAEAERMLGVAFSDVRGKSFGDYIHFLGNEGQVIGLNTPPMSQVRTEKKRIFTVSYFAHKDEGKTAFSTTFSPILVGGKFFGTIITFRDVTQDEAFSKAKSDFISLASHQLRTPLTGIKWILQEATQMKDIKEWKREYLKDAVTSTQRMIALVHNLLNVSRLETGSIAIHPAPFDMGDFVDHFVRHEAQMAANERQQTLHFRKPTTKIMIDADRSLFQQTLSNLVSNSIRYSPPNTAIDIRLSKKGKSVELAVSDHGIGIARKDQKHLFDKFFRTKDGAKYSTTGSGLGLYIVRHILNAMKGEIHCNSTVGKGTTFTVSLPLKSTLKRIKGDELFAHIIS
ncbi:HAMP domain-containing protein [Candidatus Peregrinibacteria bacterium]|nr:HAMP domain-containing protein [Candidatus Peregrinibacteria bacterium]